MNKGFGPLPFNDLVNRVPVNSDKLYDNVRQNVQHKKDLQTFRKLHWYGVDGSIVGQGSNPYFITTDSGYAFDCHYATGYAYSYDDGNATDFPIPNNAGVDFWAGDGLSVRIQENIQNSDFMNGDIPFKLLFAPGYGLSFQNALPFEYIFRGNSKIKFTITNRDNVDRTHLFAIVLGGFLIQE